MIFSILVFINPALKTASFSIGVVSRNLPTSTKNFGSLQLLRFEDLPYLGDHELVNPEQYERFDIWRSVIYLF